MSKIAAICVLFICSGFSPLPMKTHGEQDKKLTILPTPDAPLAILNATQSAEDLTIEVQNQSAFAVEYFELHSGHSRMMQGRNAQTLRITQAPGYERIQPLSLAAQEIRTFKFPTPKGVGDKIEVDTVLMANGKGWFQGVWLKRLDAPTPKGMLWGIDKEENRLRGIPVDAPDTSQGAHSGPAVDDCWHIQDYLFYDCTEGPGYPGGCGYFTLSFEGGGGLYVDFFSLADCYYAFDPDSCGVNFRAVRTNYGCPGD